MWKCCWIHEVTFENIDEPILATIVCNIFQCLYVDYSEAVLKIRRKIFNFSEHKNDKLVLTFYILSDHLSRDRIQPLLYSCLPTSSHIAQVRVNICLIDFSLLYTYKWSVYNTSSQIQHAGLEIPYHASTVCNGLKSRITLPLCVMNNKRVVTSHRCYF